MFINFNTVYSKYTGNVDCSTLPVYFRVIKEKTTEIKAHKSKSQQTTR